MLSPLCTDGVVVEPAAVMQGLWAEFWAGAEKKERLQSKLQDGLHRPLKPVQPWGSHSMSLFGPFSPSLVLKPHFLSSATSATAMAFLPLILVPKASPRHLGLLHCHSVSRSPQPRPSPLQGLSAAAVHLEAAGAEGGVQERCAVDLGAPGHVEDPCAGKAVVSRAPFPTARPRDFQHPALPWGQLQRGLSQAGTHLPHRHSPGTHRHLCRVPGAQSGRSRSSAGGPWKLQGYRRAQGQDTTGLPARAQRLRLSLLTPLSLLGGQTDGRCPPDH